jgi:hypothetical protein
MSCGNHWGINNCGDGCSCNRSNDTCYATPPANTVIISRCATQAECNSPTDCVDDPLYVSPLGVCHTFNGTAAKSFTCEGTRFGKGTVVITGCASGHLTRIPNGVCIPQNGGWTIYYCYYR